MASKNIGKRQGPSRQLVGRWQIVGAVAGVVAAIIAFVAYLFPRNGDDDRAVGSSTSSTSRTGGHAAASSEATRVRSTIYLDTLTPAAGRARLVPLPRELRGRSGYERALAITCPSNQTGDTVSEVEYETRNRFHTLRATLRPHRDPADDVRADLFVFQDSIDRMPGGPAGLAPTQIRTTMGGIDSLLAPAGAAYYLRLRVACEKPGGVVILTGAVLEA